MLRTRVRGAASFRSAVVCFVAIGSLGLAGACKSEVPKAEGTSAAVQTTTAPALPATAARPAAAEAKAAVVKEVYGDLDGHGVERYTLTNANGLMLRVITYGAIITEFHVPDRAGKMADVVLGFDKLDDYVKGSPYFGAIVGRVANRIANAKFELEGKKYTLAANNAPHHLHGGNKGWDKVVWEAEPVDVANGAALKLTHVSPDGDEGYPGKVTATTVYTLTNDNALKVEMIATADATTLVNMAHHSYWNLAGHASGSIENEVLQLFATQYTPPDGLVPDGRIAKVPGTPFDFTKPKPIGKDVVAAGGTPIGFDHNFVVDGDPHQLRPAARLHDPSSGRTMTIDADQPGIQFYSGNFLDGKAVGKGGAAYAQHSGLCLETQKFPNSINVPEWRNEVILAPGKTYQHTMIHRFSVE
jgi:aldose 1-epimerase